MGPMGPFQRTGAFYRPISESAWAKPDPRRPGGSIFMAIFPKKSLRKTGLDTTLTMNTMLNAGR